MLHHVTTCTKSSAHQSHAIAATTRNFEIGCVLPLPSTAWLFFIVTDFMNFRLVFAHGSSVQDTLDVEAPVFVVRLSSFVCPDEIQPAEVRAKGAHRPRQSPVRVRCCRFYRCLSMASLRTRGWMACGCRRVAAVVVGDPPASFRAFSQAQHTPSSSSLT